MPAITLTGVDAVLVSIHDADPGDARIVLEFSRA
jgi:hypothetical protein